MPKRRMKLHATLAQVLQYAQDHEDAAHCLVGGTVEPDRMDEERNLVRQQGALIRKLLRDAYEGREIPVYVMMVEQED